MYSKFPYTTNFSILKVLEPETSSYTYKVKLPFIQYSIYLNINKEIIKDLNLTFNEYFNKAIQLIEEINADTSADKSVILNNKSGLIASVHYTWSENLFNDFGKTLIDEKEYNKYYIKDSNIVSDPEELTDDELYNHNIAHFYNINNYNSIIDNNYFTKEELYNFTSTFFTQIEQLTTFDYNDSIKVSSNKYNSLYKSVMDYYINNKTDSIYNTINIVLSNTLSTSSSYSISTSSCGCTSSGSSAIDINESCADKYVGAMKLWLSTMLSDIDNFYYIWFYTESTDDKGNTCYVPNADLINILIKLIDEFTALDLDLSFSDSNSTFHNCNCQSKASSSASDCNYKTINNFKEVLNLILDNSVTTNQNKIKTHGKTFGELLYKLYF